MPIAKKKTTKRAVKVTGTKVGSKKVTVVSDNDLDELEIPHLRGGDWKWNFEKKPMSLADKITWVLTAVNVAILISLVIKNVW